MLRLKIGDLNGIPTWFGTMKLQVADQCVDKGPGDLAAHSERHTVERQPLPSMRHKEAYGLVIGALWIRQDIAVIVVSKARQGLLLGKLVKQAERIKLTRPLRLRQLKSLSPKQEPPPPKSPPQPFITSPPDPPK